MTTLRKGLEGSFLMAALAAGGGTASGTDIAAGNSSSMPVAAELASPLRGLRNLRQEVVLAGAIVNGNRLDLNRFVDARPAEVLEEAVKVIWSRRPAPIHRIERDGWLIMTQVTGAAIETVELRPAGLQTEGRWSRLRKGDGGLGQASAWLEAALPPGSRVLNRVVHEDGGRRLATLVASTVAGAADASEAVAFSLRNRGFRIASRNSPSLSEGGRAFFFSRASEEVAVTVSEHAGQRAVVMHWGSTVP